MKMNQKESSSALNIKICNFSLIQLNITHLLCYLFLDKVSLDHKAENNTAAQLCLKSVELINDFFFSPKNTSGQLMLKNI